MISAFFASTGRTHAAYAALLLADAFCIVEEPVTLIHVTLPYEPAMPARTITERCLTVVRLEAETVRKACDVTVDAMSTASGHVVLDLPAGCLASQRVRTTLDAAVVPVGPTPLHEHAALAALTEPGTSDELIPTAPPWLLGCGRNGGTAATEAFARRMVSRASVGMAGRPVRTLPMTLPMFGREEAGRILEGDRTARTFKASLSLLAALRVVAGAPHAEAADAVAFAEALGVEAERARSPDERDAGERLRDLADELQGIGDGVKPTAADLEGAPRLERWRFATREVRVLSGEVHGHPNFADGHRITTSDLYASDGRRWARTLSRYFTLGEPVRGPRRQGAL